MPKPPSIPVMLNVAGWRCLVVGGGAVAYRRVQTLLEAGADVTVIAPKLDARFETVRTEQASSITLIAEAFDLEQHPLSGYRLVILATDCADTHDLIAQAIAQMTHPPLLNRADEAWKTGDLAFMASHRNGPLTLGVHTGGVSASAATTIRDELADHLDPAWPEILALAQPYRERIRQAIDDPAQRRAALLSLTDTAMREAYNQGGAEAMRDRLNAIMACLPPSNPARPKP